MSGVVKCAWCGGMSTQQGFDKAFCFDCGRSSTVTGEKTVTTSQANEGVTVADLEAEENQS